MKKLLVSLFILIFFSCEDPNEPSTLPNILWLVAEDQSPEFFSMYGNDMISLPNLEKLTRDGTIYSNAYAPVPVCAPARSALITGMYPSSIGTHNMRTYNAFKDVNEPSINIPSYSPIVPEGVRMFTEYLRKQGYYCTNNSKEDYNFKPLPNAWDESSRKAHWKNRPKGTPFFSVFNFGITHESQIWKQKNEPLLVDPEKLIVPPIFPDNDIIRKDLAVNYSNLIRLDEQIGLIVNELKAEGLYDNTLIFFYSDHGGPFPRHKRAIYETGTKVPFLVKLPVGKNEKVNKKQLLSFVDLAPTVLSIAGVKSPSEYQGFAFLGKNKSKIEREFLYTSSDRFDNVSDRIRAVRDLKFKYIRNYNPENSHALNVLYRKQMLLMRHLTSLHLTGQLDEKSNNWFKSPRLMEELYDLENDPFELNNLSLDPNYTDIKKKLSLNLDEFLLKIDDLGRIPEKELIKLISSED